MEIIEIVPEGIRVFPKFTMEQIRMLKTWLDHATVSYDSKKEPEMVDANQYVVTCFYKTIKDICEDIDG